MNKFVAGHVTKMYFFFFKLWTQILQEKCWKDNVLTLKVNLSVTIKSLTRYKQKVVLAAMLKGTAANTNHTTLLKNLSAVKCLP